MPRSANQKTKLLRLAQLLLHSSDEEHPLTIRQIIVELAKYDISAERKSVYDDLETLRQLGLDVQCRKGASPGWFVAGRDFELPELKLLVDAVQSCRFLTRRKSETLIRKLEGLTSVYQAGQLQRQVYVSGRVKVMNESIYYNVDKLHAAIGRNSSITFRYFDYDVEKKKVFRREGRRYAVSPYGLIWSGELYYLAAYDHEHREMRHYRVDKMAEIALTGMPRLGGELYPDFDLAAYGQKHFGMFAGQEETVRLRCRSRIVGVVLDRFGHDVMLVPDGPEHFTVTLPLVVSPQFFGWLFGLEDNVQLLGPPSAVDAYRASLAAAAALYEGP